MDNNNATPDYSVAFARPNPPPGIEEVFDSIGRQVPGFAGFYVNEEGILVARLKDRAQDQRAGTLLRGIALALSGTEHRAPSAEVVIEGADYDFAQLRRWRDRLRPYLGLNGVTGLDANERTNRVWIGVASTGMRALLLSKAEELGIPTEAVVVEKFESPPPLATLRDSIRPLPGGMRIFNNRSPVANSCTMTLSGNHSTGFGLVTCSHCTLTQGTVDPTDFYQPNPPPSSEKIATENVDTPLFTGPPCPTGRRCAYADAAFARYVNASTGEFGTIAQPDSACHANCIDSPAALHLSDANPRWFIHSDYSGIIATGQGVQKVGQRTGWTSATITNTCFDYNDPASDITRLCQVVTDGIAYFGDSGSPVFRFVAGAGPNKVTLYGILFAGSADPPTFIFSPWPNVNAALGTIVTHPAPLSVYIDGPPSGEPFQSVEVTAVVSNGVAPFTYAWTVNGSPACGNGSSCSATLGGEGTWTDFTVTVTDAQQASAYNDHRVWVYCSTPGCVERPQRQGATMYIRP